MIPYFIVFFICFLLTLFDFSTKSRNVKNLLLIGYAVLIVFFAGIRWETGTDWDNYFSAFNTINYVDNGESGFEYFYELLMRFSVKIRDSFTIFLFLIAIIICTLTIYNIKRYSPYPLFSLLLLLSYSLNASGFGYRQDIAIAITFFSFYFIVKRKLTFFLLFLFVAILFHQSALIFLPAYWIATLNWNKKTFLYLILSLIILKFLTSQISDLSELYTESASSKVSTYSELTDEEKNMGQGNPILILIRGILNRSYLILPAFVIFYNNKSNLLYKNLLNLVIFGLILYLLVQPLGHVFLRLTRYYDIFHIILIPLIVCLSKSKNKFVLFLFYIIYCMFKFSYILFNDNYVFVPYQSIF